LSLIKRAGKPGIAPQFSRTRSELLEANRRLNTLYVLKDDLKQLLKFVYPAAALL
jgi:hypothetical protein